MKSMIPLFIGNAHLANTRENGIVYLENQVCSPELSKRLKELGVNQQSLFAWVKTAEGPDDYKYLAYRPDGLWVDEISAFTAGELGEMLPIWFHSRKRENDDWVCRVMEVRTNKNHHSFGKTEADARAKMLIYLLENKLMELSNE
jgi:hypothetical protein